MALRDSIRENEDGIFVYFYHNSVEGRVVDREKETYCQSAIMTTEHSSSSYGIPVLIFDDNGDAFGPGDVVGTVDVINRNTEDGKKWLERIENAGFNV